ncbi:LytR/AlgR family response regulator transcription factor [Flammeovirga aprica]|uniref:Response regulator transcription factor n=1 Tax=Flammeovirga aprica JL-4 TaxID=694437 RepID=A0A7X9RZR4_9BACT|nr:LytTR family DNA-binding domain-containing protein [Flammeovirga aprica]NME71777.1 response regulator transcription factor [Flammeovirga aprica JL-4]
MSTKVLIIDDEPISRRITKNFLSQIEGYEVVGEAADAQVGFTEIVQKEVDLIFLDIEMPEISGLDFLRSLAKPPKVIIISAHREYAIEGFDLNVVDYLLKPVSMERFKSAIEKFEALNTTNTIDFKKVLGDYLFIRADRKHHKINFSEILYIESQADYLMIYSNNNTTWKTKETLSAIETKLPSTFIRIHRSFIVNMEHVKAFNRELVEIGGEELPVSKSFREVVVQFFEN